MAFDAQRREAGDVSRRVIRVRFGSDLRMTRKTDRRGPSGAEGARGERGQRGARGPAGPSLSRAEILAAVEEEFADIRNELKVQLTRFGQLQAQLDRMENLLKQLVVAP